MKLPLESLATQLENVIGTLPLMCCESDADRIIASEILHIIDKALTRAVRAEQDFGSIEDVLQRIQALREILVEWLRLPADSGESIGR